MTCKTRNDKGWKQIRKTIAREKRIAERRAEQDLKKKKVVRPNPFESKEFLLTLSYDKYLYTNHWTNLRLEVFRRKGKKCSRCGDNKKIQVHHKSYRNKGTFYLEIYDLTPLCETCHKRDHGFFDGTTENRAVEIKPMLIEF